jgi:hypothetical protein
VYLADKAALVCNTECAVYTTPLTLFGLCCLTAGEVPAQPRVGPSRATKHGPGHAKLQLAGNLAEPPKAKKGSGKRRHNPSSRLPNGSSASQKAMGTKKLKGLNELMFG